MSSKNPRETRGNREVTAWDRDSQGTVKQGSGYSRQAPYCVLPTGRLSSWKTGSLPDLGAPSLCLRHSHSLSGHQNLRWTRHATWTRGC